jgi:hypothetical protein
MERVRARHSSTLIAYVIRCQVPNRGGALNPASVGGRMSELEPVEKSGNKAAEVAKFHHQP